MREDVAVDGAGTPGPGWPYQPDDNTEQRRP
jgi:hypothetical protein